MTSQPQPKFIVASPARGPTDLQAKVLSNIGRLERHYLGTRNGAKGIPESLSTRLPLIGLFSYAIGRTFPDWEERARVRTFRYFDNWVKRQMKPGMGVISSYGYAVECFRKARNTGGVTLLDGGNSHYDNFWRIISDEHARWGSDVPPLPKLWYERGLESISLTDWLFSPSDYVTNSFIGRSFPQDRILHLPYPVDLDDFFPDPDIHVPAKPLRVVCAASPSLRKGFPYLLEAMRIIRKERDAVLMLSGVPDRAFRPILKQYEDIPIDWAPMLPFRQLAKRMQSGHVFALLSLEEGLVRTACMAMACGMPVVLTPNTGASDFVVPGESGEIVPIRDPQAAASAIIACYERRISQGPCLNNVLREKLSYETYEKTLLSYLPRIDASFDPSK